MIVNKMVSEFLMIFFLQMYFFVIEVILLMVFHTTDFFLDKLNARFRRKLSNSIYLNLCCCLHSLQFFKNNITIINMYIKCASLYLQVLIPMCYFYPRSLYTLIHNISSYKVDLLLWLALVWFICSSIQLHM